MTRRRVFRECEYFTVITTCRSFQVIRYVMIKCKAKVGEQPRYSHCEVMQRWIAPDGRYLTLARRRQMYNNIYYDLWLPGTPLELRRENCIYDHITPYGIYPYRKVIPEIARAGYKSSLYGYNPKKFFCRLLTDSRVETLLKTGQTSLLRLFLKDSSRDLSKYWASICICHRNGYKIRNTVEWCDYIDALQTLGKDIRNAKYICPADLTKAHDRAMTKLVKLELENEMKNNMPAFLKKEYDFRRDKCKFFGLKFSDGLIKVKVIESVRELIEEGKRMHHCVGRYYNKTDSLVLSAMIAGKRIETVEVNLKTLQVVQSLGPCNKKTKYHNRIVSLVTGKMHLIKKRLAA